MSLQCVDHAGVKHQRWRQTGGVIWRLKPKQPAIQKYRVRR